MCGWGGGSAGMGRERGRNEFGGGLGVYFFELFGCCYFWFIFFVGSLLWGVVVMFVLSLFYFGLRGYYSWP